MQGLFGEMTQVRFVVVTPDEPDGGPPEIYCSLSVDGWPERGRALKRLAPNLYSAAGPFRAGSWLEYKFLREPTWKTVEKGRAGQELPNRGLLVKGQLREQVVFAQVLRWADRPLFGETAIQFSEPGAGVQTQRESRLTGDIRTHHLFHSPQLRNARTIMVYLPPGYDDAPAERHPVLYMQDGNNLFDARTSFSGVEWGVDETAQRLIEDGQLRRLIIVGIYNTAGRQEEYTPFPDRRRGGGNGEAYLDFVVETLKPFIDKTYRTLPDRAHTGIAGSSLGGLIALYGLFSRPDVFGLAGVMSPALSWGRRRLFTFIRAAQTPGPIRLWLDTGTEETEPGGAPAQLASAVGDCRRLVRILRARGHEPEREFHYEEVAGGRHHELDWAARVDRMLLYLFGVEAPGAAAPAEPAAEQIGR